MKAILKRLEHVDNQIKHNSKHYDKGNLALLEYERIQLKKLLTKYLN